jgi:hypothetical protein
VDSHLIVVYGRHVVKVEATDSYNKSRSSTVDFIATDIQRYNAILR